MAGGPSFLPSTGRSPTQSNHVPPYSPTNKSMHFFNHDQYQGPPRTPPPFASSTLVRSPHFVPAMPSPLPGINGQSPHHTDGTQYYQPNAASPPYQLQRTYSGQLFPAGGPSAPGSGQSSHAHPPSRSDSLARSPPKDQEGEVRNGIRGFAGSEPAASAPRPPSQEVAKPSKPIDATPTDLPPQKPTRTNDPMSFASILSDPTTPVPASIMSPTQIKSEIPMANANSVPVKSDATGATTEVHPDSREPGHLTPHPPYAPSTLDIPQTNGHVATTINPRRVLTAEENEKVSKFLNDIEDTSFSDIENRGFEQEMARYVAKRKKRVLEEDESENVKRKVSKCPTAAPVKTDVNTNSVGEHTFSIQ